MHGYYGLKNKPRTKPAAAKEGRKPVEGQDPKTGKFVAGNNFGGNGWTRTKQARDIFAAHDFDPLVARIHYHNALVAEASGLRADLLDGKFIDLSGHTHSIYTISGNGGADILDFEKVQFVTNRIDKLSQQADQIASQLADYVHPKLRAIETNSGDATSWAALMLAMEDNKEAAE